MSGQLPTPAGAYPGLPVLPIREQALAEFGEAMDLRIEALERRFVIPRKHPQGSFAAGRKRSRKPR